MSYFVHVSALKCLGLALPISRLLKMPVHM